MKNFQLTLLILLLIMVSCSQHENKTSEVSAAFPELPDVTITSVTQETEYAPHSLVKGVIGNEIKFELHLPKDWNGKFVFGGGGGFVGGVVNFALSY